MSEHETERRVRFFGGPLDGERVPLAGVWRPDIMCPDGCENGYYVLGENDRYEWRELVEGRPDP